jgi:biopolymer transport protein ExbB
MILALVDPINIAKGAGFLIWPLGLCSFVAIFIICERAVALRGGAIMPADLTDSVLQGKPMAGGPHSVLGRIIQFTEKHPGDDDGAKAYARLEVIKMERGVSYLDMIYTGAPLIGLVGTVFGLLSAFAVVDPETKMPDPAKFTESVGYALSATLIGLLVALVALAGNGYLQRRIDSQAARLDVLLERILARTGKSKGQTAGKELLS